MNFRKWIDMSEAQGYPQLSFNYDNGLIVVTTPEGGRYVYDSPNGHGVFRKWEAMIRAHPSNGGRIFNIIQNLVNKNTPNWKQLEPKPVPVTAPAPAPGKMIQREMF